MTKTLLDNVTLTVRDSPKDYLQSCRGCQLRRSAILIPKLCSMNNLLTKHVNRGPRFRSIGIPLFKKNTLGLFLKQDSYF